MARISGPSGTWIPYRYNGPYDRLTPVTEPKEESHPKHCNRCHHSDVNSYEQPCSSCENHSVFQPQARYRKQYAPSQTKHEQALAKLKARQAAKRLKLEVKETARVVHAQAKEAKKVAKAEAKAAKQQAKERKAQLVNSVEFLKDRVGSQCNKNSALLTDIVQLKQQLSAQAERIATQDQDLQEAKRRLADRITALGTPIDFDAEFTKWEMQKSKEDSKWMMSKSGTPGKDPEPTVERKCNNCKYNYNDDGKMGGCKPRRKELGVEYKQCGSGNPEWALYVEPAPLLCKDCANHPRCKVGGEADPNCYVKPEDSPKVPPVNKCCDSCYYNGKQPCPPNAPNKDECGPTTAWYKWQPEDFQPEDAVTKEAATPKPTKTYTSVDKCTVCNLGGLVYEESIRTGKCRDCRQQERHLPYNSSYCADCGINYKSQKDADACPCQTPKEVSSTFTNAFGVELPIYCRGCACVSRRKYTCQLRNEDSICGNASDIRKKAFAGNCRYRH